MTRPSSMGKSSLVRYTIRSFWCQGCVQTDFLSGNHKTSPVPSLDCVIKKYRGTQETKKVLLRVTKHTKRKTG